MSTAGPELPPHLLAKRKRLEEAESRDSAQDKPRESLPRRSRSNSNSSTSDSSKRRRTLGPSLPQPSNPQRTIPEAPPDSSDRRDSREYSDNTAGPKRPRILGPSLPPAPLSERPFSPPTPNDSSSDDDDFGPAPPPTFTDQLHPSQSITTTELSPTSNQFPPKPKREEWMLVPPSQSDWSSRIDPTKLRNRKFNTGKGAKAPPPKTSGDDNALWTETPEQKQKRLTDEVMGVVAKPGSAAASSSANNNPHQQTPQQQAEALETERRIQDYNAQHRAASLYSEHQKRPRKEQEDDPSARAFDREKDVVRGTKIGRAQKQEMLNRAADFGERFTKGSFL